MKAHVKTARLVIEVEGNTVKELFKNISTVEDAFNAENKCGMEQCGSGNIRFQVRTIEDNDFFELLCNDCGATFSFGQHKKAPTLFPKRTNKDDKPLPNRGWSHYVGKTGKAA